MGDSAAGGTRCRCSELLGGAGAMQGHGAAAVCAGSPSYLITAGSQATPASVLIAGPLLGPSQRWSQEEE